MKGDLLINGVDAFDYGVVMGDDFINTLRAPVAFKEDIENNSAIEHGIRVVLSAFKDARDITLKFNIHGSDSASYKANEAWFLSVLYGRIITIQVSGDDNYYRLLYKSSVSYGRNVAGTTSIVSVKFTEINPDDRANTPKNSLFGV